ncbi:sacsin [Brachionus plicatilis]|uniref:Sacsin n=1 Tax=Brachionus plicatilis TaxID=10195 RepID=A0A3M7SFD9_BRAPC|nr:sacsin [Brachionus plicatilis]
MISDSELSELISVPKEWRCGDEKIQWPRNHDKHNLTWLETLWKYLNENFATNLSIVENLNIIYTSPSHSSSLLHLYKLSNNSNLVYTPAYTTLDDSVSIELYDNLVRILKKLDFQCIDCIPEPVLGHPLFFNYVPNVRKSRLGLLQAFKNKYRHASTLKIIQDFNALLDDLDIKLVQKYLAKVELTHSSAGLDSNQRELLEFIKFVPMFENSAVECADKYIAIKECSHVYYDTQVRLPFELPGLQSFIFVDSLDTKTLIQDKLGLDICKEFTFILRQIIEYVGDRERNSLNSIKIHLLGKWLLLNCSTYVLASTDLNESVRSTKLFLNQSQELCAPSQFINPGKNDKYLAVLEAKTLPCQDLLGDDKCVSVLKELKMRSYTQLKIDEIIDLFEQSTKWTNEVHRRLLAELIVEILVSRHEQNETLLVEYSASKAVNLRHYLTSVNWIPLKKERPQCYPQSLVWRGAEPAMNTRFSSPRDCVDQSYSYCVGSVSCISDLDIPNQLKDFLDLKKVHLDQVVRHLKITTKCFESSALKIEWYDYLTVAKKCYEFMCVHEAATISRELKANDLTEWVWTGERFSSISSVYLLNDKDHPLSSHLDTLPYELYPYLAFFESIGMKKTPDAKQLELIILKCVKNTHKLINSAKLMSKDQILENAAKNYPLINYIKLNYPNEAKLINNIKDYEESLVSLSSSLNPFVSQPSVGLSINAMANEASTDLIYLYLPDVYKSADIKDNLINSVMSLIKTKHFKLLDEEAYLIKKSHQSANLYDHYRVYNEIILPNLNNLSKNVKDSVVLFALDHADTKMLEILKDHPCIPVSPYGRRIKKPNKLIHPNGKLAPLYAESDERFPFGSEQAYIREDRLQILKILGMKCDQLTWSELIERAESVSKIREYDQAVERSIAILNILNEMLSSQEEIMKKANQDESQELKEIGESLKEISFIAVKQKPYQKLNVYWFGDRFKYRFAKPKELLSSQYELIASSIVSIPLNEYKKKENLLTKSVEKFLSIDDCTSKLTFKDVLKHLEELSKSNLCDLDDPKEVKLLNDMVYQVYEFIQSECLKTPQLTEYIRLFFHDKKLILINDDFVLVSQVILSLNFNLKPIYYQLPQQYHRSFKHLFSQVLPIKPDLDLNDLLLIIDVVKRKYKDVPITNKDDFNLILNVYALIVDHGYKSINNLHLPNANSVLVAGRLLTVSPIETKTDNLSDFVHASVDRRVCLIAGCKFTDSHLALVCEQRVFPRVFGNKRLEGILTRLDDERIDLNLMSSLDEGNPLIVLEYLLQCNRVHSLSQFLSDDDIFVLLKYFNDFLARNYQHSQFTRLKELKIYRPLFADKYTSLSGPPASIYLINEDLFSLIKRSLLKQTFDEATLVLIKRNELLKLYAHLGLNNLNDVENFLNICLPLFAQIDAKTQNNFLKYLYDEILEKIYSHEKEKCMKILRERLVIQTRSGHHKLITDLYDFKSECLVNILNESYFPDEAFDSATCIRFLKEAGLRTYLPSELCKRCMNDIERSVTESGWCDQQRLKSKYIYQHLVENWQRFDDSVLQQRFLEPYEPDQKFVCLKKPFEHDQFKHTCLKLSDAELHIHELLVWTSSFILPAFVNTAALDINTVEFLKLNKKPCFALVNVHLNNICADSHTATADQTCLIEALCHVYKYLNEMNVTEADKDILRQLEDKEIVWSGTTRKFVSPSKVCVNLAAEDECPPFVYALSSELHDYKSLLIRLGAKDKPYAMLYGDILRKMAKVCADDYLNSNELCKALKAMQAFFKYLKLNADTITPQFKLPGLYFLTTELKLEKSSNCVIVDSRDSLDDLAKLSHDKFVFNPGEKCFKMCTSEIKPLIDKIFISQRPTLFTQKYESTYDYTLPDDPDSQRQNLLTSLERKYQQIFTSRQLHRCLARCISNEEARRSSPKHLAIDEVEKVIRDRLSSIKVTCVEYLETSLSYRKLSNQQKIEQTVEEKACYLTNENHQFSTLYVSKKHIEQPYFSLCLARSLQPLLLDLHFDYSVFTSLMATSVSLMSRLLQLVNVATEENILSVIKLQYVPSSGKLYGDDVQLLAPYDPKLHSVLVGDLCVFLNEQGAYLYCQIVDMSHEHDHVQVQVADEPSQSASIHKKDLYVLENWQRIYDAMQAKPADERESFKYSENFGDAKPKASSNQQSSAHSNESNCDDSSNGSDTSDVKSETSSNYDGSSENIPTAFELEQAKNEVNGELRSLWSLEENERKKKINRLLLKWHPDKNTGKEKFASEVFKHLKKQIELYKNDPFLAGFNYRSSYSSYTPGGFSAGAYSSTAAGDDYRSRHYNSFENLNRKGSPSGSGGHSPHSSPSRDPGAAGAGFDYDAKGPGPSNLGRAGSFRQEWERRRQQKRQTGTGTDSSEFFFF